MMDILRKLNMKTAIIMALCFYSIAILIHVLVISSIIPYIWINGGRSESLSAQIPISVISIIILIFGVLFTLTAGGVIPFKFNRSLTVISWFFVILWSIGLVQQLLGTNFERYFISFTMLLGIISNLRLALEKRN